MENSHHIKSISTDPRSKNRLRFKSSRQRAKAASADVYRSYKRRIGVTSAASCEERVHHPSQEETRDRKRRRRGAPNDGRTDKVAVLHNDKLDVQSSENESHADFESTFSDELDLAFDRNSSEIFRRFYREVWPLARSLPEVLHNASAIVDILMAYMLSLESDSKSKSPPVSIIAITATGRAPFVTNHATTDILHLLAVLARDLRHEIHPFVHSLIVPRIVHDLLNPPPPPPESGKQPIPVNVPVVEAAFRALSYVFRYDAEPILNDVEYEGQEPCLERLRQYYGATLGNRRDYVRRLAAEMFAPMIRKLKLDAWRRRHLRRVMRALAASANTVAVQDGRTLSDCLTRSQGDAIDGVAFLFFETAHGVNGRLHSKGRLVVRCLFECVVAAESSSKTGLNTNRIELMQLVALSFIDKLCHFLKPAEFGFYLNELQRISRRIATTIGNTGSLDTAPAPVLSPLAAILNFWARTLNFRIRDSKRMEFGDGGTVDCLVDLLGHVLTAQTYVRYPEPLRTLVLQVLALSWETLHSQALFASQIGNALSELLKTLEDEALTIKTASFLARELLPKLPLDIGIRHIGTPILSAAAHNLKADLGESLMVLLSVAGAQSGTDAGRLDTHDDFVLEGAHYCQISADEREKLIKLCLIDLKAITEVTPKSLSEIGAASRCLPFLVKSTLPEERLRYRTLVLKWTYGLMETLDNTLRCNFGTDSDLDIVETKALALESLSSLLTYDKSADVLEMDIARLCPFVRKMIVANPQSLWVVRSVASYVTATAMFKVRLFDHSDEPFDILVSNLRAQDHFLRLYTLKIFVTLPKRPFVMDHAVFDWTDDMDEEPVMQPELDAPRAANDLNGPTGLCDLLDILLVLESTPANLENERILTSSISRVEVLARSGRLPVAYTEAAANHMLGVFHIKFAPIWPVSTRALVVLASRNEGCAWPPLLEALKQSMYPRPVYAASNDLVKGSPKLKFLDHVALRALQDKSSDSSASVLVEKEKVADARLPHHSSTDELTLCEIVWGVIEKLPELAAKKSRFIVPMFLEFLRYQYFRLNVNDADARELGLTDEMGDKTGSPRDSLRSAGTQRRLLCFLRTFSAISGPRQLFRHEFLLSIFTMFLSHRETVVAKIALACVLKYKLPYVMPYADQLEAMLRQGGLRDALLQINISKTGGGMFVSDHRQGILPIVTRILFGRLSSRVAAGKSSKETPSMRRSAVLSFLSVISDEESDLYPLFYLMVRSYVLQESPKPIELHGAEDVSLVEDALKHLKPSDITHLPTQRHEGFLNLLKDVISQLGNGIQGYVPSFFGILIALCQYSEVGVSDGDCREDFDSADHRSKARIGHIRTLCFRRFADCFDQYADSVDFLVHAGPLWSSISRSLHMLPRAAATADRAPALLTMLVTISRHASLIPLLQLHDAPVGAVVDCIAPSTEPLIMDAVLKFLDNLLTNGGTEEEEGVHAECVQEHGGILLIRDNMSLLLQRFSLRLGSSRASDAQSRCTVSGANSKWQEISILCRLSRIILRGNNEDNGSYDMGVLKTLCDILIGFLRASRRGNSVNQLQVIQLLSALIPRIDGTTALSHLPALSGLLGPSRVAPGTSTLSTRTSLALLIRAMCACPDTPSALQVVSEVVVQLCSSHSKRVDELDYDVVLSALSNLVNEEAPGSWVHLCGAQYCGGDPSLLLPIVQTCFHLIYSDDGVVSRAAFVAIKSLISSASRAPGASIEAKPLWTGFVEKSVVPGVRAGISDRSQSARRIFILLIAEVARWFKESSSPNLYGDLSLLIRDDEPDLDFFLSITHVQIHRRCRALQRLIKTLDSQSSTSVFHVQTLSNILLPIALHPIYESETRLEEPFALDAVSAVGAIARYLSWNKYHNTLWTSLLQFERHAKQERYIVDMICAILDSFHFELRVVPPTGLNAEDECMEDGVYKSAVWRALETRIIPKVEQLLVKEKVGAGGNKTKRLRPRVVLALLKLCEKFPKHFFESRLPRLLAIICESLKSKDSDTREVARTTLAKMVSSMRLEYLHDVIYHLKTSLSEGFQLHVRMASLHTILLLLSDHYGPHSEVNRPSSFDRCIPGMMDLIQQDLFGTAQERRDAEGTKKRFVKEASGSKSHDSIELICRMLYFKPSDQGTACGNGASSVHLVVVPLLGRLKSEEIGVGTIGKIRECLNRVLCGLSKNPSLTIDEALSFIYATISPFASAHDEDEVNETESDEDCGSKIVVSSETGADANGRESHSGQSKSRRVVEWRPSSINTSNNRMDARNTRVRIQRALHVVRDGYCAPKLTGSSRLTNTSRDVSQSLNDPSSICAVVFGLGLFHATLKKTKPQGGEARTTEMFDAFTPLLTTCVCFCKDNDVVLLSLRCLSFLLRMKLPSFHTCSMAIGAKALDILTSSGALSNLHQELTQSCFKTLTLLISCSATQFNINPMSTESATQTQTTKAVPLPLNASQMQVLISLLAGAAVEVEHHNPTFGLIKAITSRRYISSEFYDLMATCLKLSVRSPKAAVRQMSANIFIQYLREYPMGKQRLEDHLKQIVSNTRYQYEEGRLSAIRLAATTIEKMPAELLDEHTQLFFLPLVLQLVNDESKKCREAVAKCISRLLVRVSIERLQAFYDYTVRWSNESGSLQRTSLQIFGIMVESRPDFMKRGSTIAELVGRLGRILNSSGDESEWEMRYFALVCLEKIAMSMPNAEWIDPCLVAVVQSLAHPHPWVKRAACRLVVAQLLATDPLSVSTENDETSLAKIPGLFFNLARNICSILDMDEPQQDVDLSTSAIKSLTWFVQSMRKSPELWPMSSDSNVYDPNPLRWVVTRLSQIAKPKGCERRKGIFKCFASFATVGGTEIVIPYLELMIEPLHRSIVESENNLNASSSRSQLVEESEETTFARDTLQLLEDCCREESESFFRAYSNVKTRALDKKEKRKQHVTAEAILDPEAAATRKIKKQDQEKKRRKRRVEERRLGRGGRAKRRHV